MRANFSAAAVSIGELEQPRPVTDRRQHLINTIELVLLEEVALIPVAILAVAHQLRLVETVEDRAFGSFPAEVQFQRREVAHLQTPDAARTRLYRNRNQRTGRVLVR